MEVEIVKKRDLALLDRQRVTAMVTYDGGATPSIMSFKETVAAQLKVKPEFVAIRHVYQRYGFTKAKVIAHIYKDRATLLKMEKMKKAEKKVIEVAKKAAEEKVKVDAEAKKAVEEAAKVVEASKEEASAEETKEEGSV